MKILPGFALRPHFDFSLLKNFIEELCLPALQQTKTTFSLHVATSHILLFTTCCRTAVVPFFSICFILGQPLLVYLWEVILRISKAGQADCGNFSFAGYPSGLSPLFKTSATDRRHHRCHSAFHWTAAVTDGQNTPEFLLHSCANMCFTAFTRTHKTSWL